MNEQERADWLARAVDNLIQRREAAEPPEHLNDKDIEGLMRVAKARLELAESTAHAGLQYEGAVWQKVLDRLEIREAKATRAPGAATFFLRKSRSRAGSPDPAEQDLRELEDVAVLRKSMSAEMMAFAETKREAVWQKIQARLAARNAKKGFLSFLRRARREADDRAPALDGIIVGQAMWQSVDSRIDDLIQLARKRRTLGRMAQETSAESDQRAWSRVRGTAHDVQSASTAVHKAWVPAWQRLAAGAGVLALVVAAIGPLPATGVAHHPFVNFVETVGQHVGVTESGAPPAESGVAAVLEGTPTTAAEASQLLGVPVSEPATVPAGFALTGSVYYPDGLTSDRGVFLLSYTSVSGALLVFQEAASAADLGVHAGAVEDITLPDGTPATYFAGGWTPAASSVAWTSGDAGTLVFDSDGVRTIIQYVGDDADAVDLAAVAATLRQS